MNWNVVRTQEDVTVLNEIYGNFHDCCLKEVCFSTGGYVTENFAMNVLGLPIARFLF